MYWNDRVPLNCVYVLRALCFHTSVMLSRLGVAICERWSRGSDDIAGSRDGP